MSDEPKAPLQPRPVSKLGQYAFKNFQAHYQAELDKLAQTVAENDGITFAEGWTLSPAMTTWLPPVPQQPLVQLPPQGAPADPPQDPAA